jgi:hypothetical protein
LFKCLLVLSTTSEHNGRDGEEEDKALKSGVITIGWNELPDLSNVNSKYDLETLYLKYHQNFSRNKISNQVRQIWNFVKRIKKNDIVVIPLKTKNSEILSLGIVEGDYEYRQVANEVKHIRQVKWLRQVPKSEFEQDLWKYLRLPMTVFILNKKIDNYISNLLAGTENLQSSQDNKSFKLTKQTLPEIISDFKHWLKTESAQKHIITIEKEKKEVKDLMEKLGAMDKNSPEFVDLVLYGLLPYSKTKFAKRVSTFPVFMNIKLFFKNYNYSELDWRTIANLINSLAKKFQDSPEKLQEWITEFTSDSIHSRSLQCGSISPILFCINDKFPIVNNRVIYTYNELASIYDWEDIMSKKLDKYLTNVDKCHKLISFLDIPEITDFTVFDLFCYWYDYLYEKKEQYEGDDEGQYVTGQRIRVPEINMPSLPNTLELQNFEQQYHSLRNPERIKINQIILNSEKGSLVLPNFQRYFEWKKKDVKEFLESIVKDYYVGALIAFRNNFQGSSSDSSIVFVFAKVSFTILFVKPT